MADILQRAQALLLIKDALPDVFLPQKNALLDQLAPLGVLEATKLLTELVAINFIDTNEFRDCATKILTAGTAPAPAPAPVVAPVVEKPKEPNWKLDSILSSIPVSELRFASSFHVISPTVPRLRVPNPRCNPCWMLVSLWVFALSMISLAFTKKTKQYPSHSPFKSSY